MRIVVLKNVFPLQIKVNQLVTSISQLMYILHMQNYLIYQDKYSPSHIQKQQNVNENVTKLQLIKETFILCQLIKIYQEGLTTGIHGADMYALAIGMYV